MCALWFAGLRSVALPYLFNSQWLTDLLFLHISILSPSKQFEYTTKILNLMCKTFEIKFATIDPYLIFNSRRPAWAPCISSLIQQEIEAGNFCSNWPIIKSNLGPRLFILLVMLRGKIKPFDLDHLSRQQTSSLWIPGVLGPENERSGHVWRNRTKPGLFACRTELI